MASIFFICAYSIILDIDNPENENKVAIKIKSSFIRMVKIMSKKHIPDLSCLMANLPPIVARNKIEHYLPGLFSRRYMQNLDSQGRGPKKFKIGAKVVYQREDLLAWLIGKIHYDVSAK